MEGMASWTTRAWWQLTVCSALLAAMAVLAPLAAGAAGVAWTSHAVLTQVSLAGWCKGPCPLFALLLLILELGMMLQGYYYEERKPLQDE